MSSLYINHYRILFCYCPMHYKFAQRVLWGASVYIIWSKWECILAHHHFQSVYRLNILFYHKFIHSLLSSLTFGHARFDAQMIPEPLSSFSVNSILAFPKLSLTQQTLLSYLFLNLFSPLLAPRHTRTNTHIPSFFFFCVGRSKAPRGRPTTGSTLQKWVFVSEREDQPVLFSGNLTGSCHRRSNRPGNLDLRF